MVPCIGPLLIREMTISLWDQQLTSRHIRCGYNRCPGGLPDGPRPPNVWPSTLFPLFNIFVVPGELNFSMRSPPQCLHRNWSQTDTFGLDVGLSWVWEINFPGWFGSISSWASYGDHCVDCVHLAHAKPTAITQKNSSSCR
jgi:hypothetical protein